MWDIVVEENKWSQLRKVIWVLEVSKLKPTQKSNILVNYLLTFINLYFLLKKYFNEYISAIIGQTFPTIYSAIPVYNLLIDQLEDLLDIEDDRLFLPGQRMALEAALEKLKKYYSKTGTSIFSISTGK